LSEDTVTSPKALARLMMVAACVVVAACADQTTGGEAAGGTPSPQATVEPEASPTGAVAEEGGEAPTETACVNGWTVPEDPEQYELPFHVIRRTLKVDGDFDVDELRYFEGPESPPSDKGYLLRVDRWYVKATLATDPAFRGRWLIEERAFGSGLAAAAPYDSQGFASPDWVGFLLEEGASDDRRRRHPGLPGKWAGTAYDFVTGEGAFNFPGLPAEVIGCLEGT
jgi:hypothetical protein